MKQNIIVISINRKEFDEELESVELITYRKSFALDELQSAKDWSDDSYYTFNKFLKRYLLKSLSGGFSTCELVIEQGDTKNILKVYSTDYAYSVNEGEYINSAGRGAQIRKIINEIHYLYNIRNLMEEN